MKLFGIIAGILCLFCWCIPSEAEKIDCPGASPKNIPRSYFLSSVMTKKYWTVMKTGNTNYKYHPLGKNIDTLVTFSDMFRIINNYYDDDDDLTASNKFLFIKHEKYFDPQMDDEKVIYKTRVNSSRLYGEKLESGRMIPSLFSYDTPIDIEYSFALIDEKDNFGVLIFESCSSNESDKWYLIEHSLLRNATGPDGTLNTRIGGIRVDHMPKLHFTPSCIKLI